ncbi:MAG: short-chain dehydrogenase [Solirubrobacterales bacterium]|jgi:NAD(P)-dependent dehydrogenase (short-subunit alcohol dehydrogenase family)|nr:short-chain dehydrogenase [Solirubrobacterales bacterium]
MYDVRGRVALVTGGARGIGFATARGLYDRGASVALVDLGAEEAEASAAKLGDRAIGIAADVTDRDAIEAAVQETVERLGGLDIVVANAGIAPAAATTRAMDYDAFERVIEVNLLGVWRTVRAGLPHVVERQGHVVVVASVYAFVNGVLLSPYAIAKAGVEQMGRALRAELAPHGASASVAYFGFIDTEMVRDGMSDPVANALEDSLPAFMLRRLPPSTAGRAIVEGIETRAPRIIRPKWWTAHSVLRGILNPLLDRYMERDKRTQDAIRAGDDEHRVTGPKIVAGGDRR